jgi:hypothetical protein
LALFLPSDDHRSFTLALTPFRPSSSFQEDRYVDANISEAHLVSGAQSIFPFLIFNFSTGMDFALQSPFSPGRLANIQSSSEQTRSHAAFKSSMVISFLSASPSTNSL